MRPRVFRYTLLVMITLSPPLGSKLGAQSPYNGQMRQAQTGLQTGVEVSDPVESYVRPAQAVGLSDSAWTATPVPSNARNGASGATASVPVLPRPLDAPQATALPMQDTTPASESPRPLKPPASADAHPRSPSTSTWGMLVSVGSSLSIVIALILGAGWVYRRATPNASVALPKQVLQVLGRTPISPRQQLVLLRFGAKLVLVSNLQGEVRTISEITDPLEVDQLAGLCQSVQPGSITESFRSVLHQIGSNRA